ncbi:MAG: cupin domain-containing protein [Methanobacteriota archaeon]|nr:MAG: cupin domain-containing protein [Euryarchaeota archaeon]
MDAHEIADLLRGVRVATQPYSEFLRVPSMSLGIYTLPASGEDPQSPHSEDEVYYVIEGRARIRVGGEDREVSPGSLVFVPARVEHRFHSIREKLSLLVIFAPAEGSQSTASPPRVRRDRQRSAQSSRSARRR